MRIGNDDNPKIILLWNKEFEMHVVQKKKVNDKNTTLYLEKFCLSTT